MLLLELTFNAGRFHATPWGRHVNEGVVEWPPAPYRIARALIDVWKRRRPDWPGERVTPLLAAWAGTPRYHLPPSVASHMRSYLDTGTVSDPTDKQKILDGFVVLERNAKVIIGLEARLEPDQIADLGQLLAELSYLGRAESWITARVLAGERDGDLSWNCVPAESKSGSELVGRELTRVACLRRPDDYGSLEAHPQQRSKKRATSGRSSALSWTEALCLGTSELLRDGWSAPPALLSVPYLRDPLAPRRAGLTQQHKEIRVARYAISGNVLPRVTRGVILAEDARRYLMGIHRKRQGGDPTRVSKRFSGKDSDGGPAQGHPHAFYLPLDEDRDGHIDHLEVRCVEPFDATELDALDHFRRIHHGDRQIDLVLVDLSTQRRLQRDTRWISATPFVTVRHHRRGRGSFLDWLDQEIRRECAIHGLPSPAVIEWIPHAPTRGTPRWMEFVRNRKGERPLPGHGCVLSFDEEVSGPFVLGAGCHFGLGLFMKADG